MYKNKYPVILLHGFMGFGEQDGIDKFWSYWGFRPDIHLIQYLRSENYEVFAPSIGPVGSAWDRACDAYYRIIGGTVDYGKVHSEKYHHARFGRTYPGILPDWGQPGRHEKIDLVGHSFGGPTVIEVCQLFSFGDEDERRGTDPEDLSPLFAGGHGDLIHTVTTMSGVNNGTLMASALGVKGMTAATYFVLMIASMVGETRWTKFWDFKLQHFGIGKFADQIGKHGKFRSPFSHLDHVHDYAYNMDRDNSGREMQVEVIQPLNQALKMDPHIYYFAQRADSSVPGRKGDGSCRPKFPMDPLCFFSGFLTGRFTSPELARYGVGSDPLWRSNDGFVNVRGQSAPLNLPSEEADYSTDFKPGIWYNMPIEKGDHMFWIGLWRSRKSFFATYDRLLDLYAGLPDGDASAK